MRLKRGGADALVICTNTMHKMVVEVETATALPVLHIVDATAVAIREKSLKKSGHAGNPLQDGTGFL